MEKETTGDDGARATRILFVDDEQDVELLIRQKMRRQVRKGHYELSFALNGREALEELASQGEAGPEMVVTDINMPVMNGLELLGKLAEQHPGVKAIVVSAYGDMENIRAAMNLGAFDFVTKPINFPDLEATIERTAAYVRRFRRWMENVRGTGGNGTSDRQEMANSVRRYAVPNEPPSNTDYSTAAKLHPGSEIGGEFTDVVTLQGGRIGLVSAQAPGTGLQAALLMMGVRSLVRGAAIGTEEPAQMIEEAKRMAAVEGEHGKAIQIVYATYRPRTGLLAWARSARPAPLIVRAGGRVEEAIGTQTHGGDIETGETELGPGDAAVVRRADIVTSATVAKARERWPTSQIADAIAEAVGEAFKAAPPPSDRSYLVLTRHRVGHG